jgi:transcriptional regulator with XRE-family HTH domain
MGTGGLMASDLQREELADFLRTRRARLVPADVGISPSRRRRTPGLRREEVAQLAGISVTWYTRLEQAQDIRVSARALEGIARALQLTPDECKHLFTLAHQPAPPSAATDERSTPALQQVLDALGACPAYLIGRRWDILAWNRATTVLGDFPSRPSETPNLLAWLFTIPEPRRVFVDWEGHARAVLAQFRVSYSRHAGEPAFTELVAMLKQTSQEFARWWAYHDVLQRGEWRKELDHPSVGRLTLQHLTFEMMGAQDLRLVIQPPEPGSDTAGKIQQLIDRIGTSRRDQ